MNDIELTLCQIDLAAKERDACSILLRLMDELEGVAVGAGSAAEHAHDQLWIV
jgi:hypothetical protein